MTDFDKVEIIDVVDDDVPNLDAAAGVAPDTTEEALGEQAKRHRLNVSIRFHDGRVLQGELGVGGNNRLSDYLNSAKDFLVVLESGTDAHIINKQYIVEVVEIP